MVATIKPNDVFNPSCVVGVDGDGNYRVFTIDAAGHLQIDVLSSALPTGASTSAHQVTQNTALGKIDDLQGALHSINTDHLHAHIQESVLPTGAATQTTLALCLVALAKIDDLQNALGTVATDWLRIAVVASVLPTGAATQATLASILTRIPDQMATFGARVVGQTQKANATGTQDFLNGTAVPANQIHVITGMGVRDQDNNFDYVNFGMYADSKTCWVGGAGSGVELQALGWSGHIYLGAGEYVRVEIKGAIANDNLDFWWTGYGFTKV